MYQTRRKGKKKGKKASLFKDDDAEWKKRDDDVKFSGPIYYVFGQCSSISIH